MKRPTSEEMLTLIKRLPDAENHIHICCIDGKHCITNEFFTGAFGSRAFEGGSYEEAAEQLIDYMYEHIGHNSIVGMVVTESGFPDLDRVYEYCKPELIDGKKVETEQYTIPSVSKWVACKDKMPPNDSMCIIYRGRLETVDYAYYDEGFEFPYMLFGEDKKEGKYRNVTHWQPRPDPPYS